jgi:hypothetical protein
MKTIIFSDCHGRPDLITNVLDHVNDWDRAIFAGDILDVGDHPIDCFNILKENSIELLWGNHDLAVLLNQRVWPQNPYDNEARNIIMDHQKDFRVATNVNNILVTHAGLTDYFYNNYFDKEISDVREIANCLNGLPLSDFWQDASPLWYRPGNYYKPMSIRQIVGHTPPGWIERSGIELNNFVSVDPYSQEGFGPDRYRYALIENGEISIFDSNRK